MAINAKIINLTLPLETTLINAVGCVIKPQSIKVMPLDVPFVPWM
jgi:hypothetical protein